MRELLFFPENLTKPLQWASYDLDGQLALHDPIEKEALGHLKPVSKKGVTLVLPGQRVASYHFPMPRVTGQAKEKAIAFALEGVCSQSLEEVYVIPGDYIDGKQSAMVIDQVYLDGVLGIAKECRLKVMAIRVDYMLLKKPEFSSWVATCAGNDVLWRTDESTGGRVEATLWPFILQQIFDQNKRLPKVILWVLTGAGSKPQPLPEQVASSCEETFKEVSSWVDVNALASHTHYQFNVGPNKLRSLFNKRKKSLSRTIKILVSAIIFSVVSQLAFTTFLQIKLNKERSVLNKWLTPLGLSEVPLSEIKLRLKRAIQSAEKVQAEDSFVYMLSQVTNGLSPEEKTALISLSFDTKQGLILQFPRAMVVQIAQILKQKMPAYQVAVQPIKKHKPSSTGFVMVKQVVL